MPHYYVNQNAQSNGDHEVHEETCYWLSLTTHRLDLGYHSACYGAVAAARQYYPQSNGCAYCCPLCNTG